MSELWNPNLESLTPYVPGEQAIDSVHIKLNTNENPYPPSPKVSEALEQFNWKDMRRYPDPSCKALKNKLAQYYKLDSKQVFVGNGSDEVLAHAFRALFKPEQAILLPEISYGFYPVYQKLFELKATTIPLNNCFEIDLSAYQQSNGGIIFANPNAPTGAAITLDKIEDLLQVNTDSVVIIDEAYSDFGNCSAVKLIQQYPQLLIIKTFSKSRSLAGLRVGYALGNAKLIEALERVKFSFHPYTLNQVQMTAAIAAIEDEAYFQDTLKRLKKTREFFANQLTILGFKVLPSEANFIFAQPPSQTKASTLQQASKQQGILVRYFTKPDSIAKFIRISIGTEQEMNETLKVIKKHLESL